MLFSVQLGILIDVFAVGLKHLMASSTLQGFNKHEISLTSSVSEVS